MSRRYALWCARASLLAILAGLLGLLALLGLPWWAAYPIAAWIGGTVGVAAFGASEYAD